MLLLIAGVAVTGGILSQNTLSTDTSSAARRSESESGSVAREAAESGFAVTMGQVARDFQARPVVVRGVSLDGGKHGAYDAAVTETGRGPLNIDVTGYLGDARHQIAGQAMPLATIGAALVIASESATFAPNGSLFEIRGADHRQPGAIGQVAPLMRGSGLTGSAVRASSNDLASAFTAPLKAAMRPRLSGMQPEADVSVGALPPVVTAMYEQALTVGTRFTGDTKFSDRTLGAPGSPVVYVVEGKVELSGTTRGYGLLVVQGDFKMKDTARWEGVVIVQADSDEKLSVEMERNATVVGSLVLLGVEDRYDDSDAGLPGGHFDVDVYTRTSSGMKRAYHKHQYDDSYNVTHVDLLGGPGIATYWNALRSAYAGRSLRVELFNTFNGSGTMTLASPAGAFTVPNCGAFATTVVPNLVTTFRTSFVDLKQLRGTSPGTVSGDAVNRARSYSIRLYDGTTLVYEMAAYEHARARDGYGCSSTSGPGGVGGGGLGSEVGNYGRFDVAIKDNATLLYSEEAVGQVGFALSSIRNAWRVGHEVLSSVPR